MERRRIHLPGAMYYVVLRSAHTTRRNPRRPAAADCDLLFGDDLDREEFVRRVLWALGVGRARLHAYCLMPSDVRMLIEVSQAPLGKLIKLLTVPYSRWRNTRRKAEGHVFQQRYAATILNNDMQVREVVRHIHRSPVAGNMASSLREHLWSSHRQYLSRDVIPWITTHRVLRLFGDTDKSARRAYGRYVAATERAFSQYVVGDRPFMLELRPVEYKDDTRTVTLDDVVVATCRHLNVSEADLVSPCRARHLSLARALVHRQATLWGIATGRDVSERLNRDPSSLFVGVERYRKLYPELFGMPLRRFLDLRAQTRNVLPVRRLPSKHPGPNGPTLTDAQLARRIQRALRALSRGQKEERRP